MSKSLFGASFQDAEGEAKANAAEGIPQQFNFDRRTSVSAESMLPSFEAHTDPASRDDANGGQAVHLVEYFRSIFLFSDISNDSIHQVLNALVRRRVSADTVIIKQGDEGDFFYILETGEVRYTKDGEDVGASGPGSYFGELALLYNAPRAATVTAVTDATVWALDRLTFKNIMMRKLTDRREHSRRVLSSVDILKHLDLSTQLKLADALQPVSYEPGAIVIREGDPGDNFYLVDEGEAVVSRNGAVVATLSTGHYFGEVALLNDLPRTATITASTPLKLEKLDKLGFERLLGQDVVAELRKREPPRGDL